VVEAVDEMIPGGAGRLAVRAKGLDRPTDAAVVMVQGALLPGQTAFDLDLDVGPADLSLMNVVAGWGLAAVTFAVRGYGESDVPEDPLHYGTEEGIEDLRTVIDWTRKQTGLERVSLLSWSWGSRVAGRFTERDSAVVDRLVLMDPALGGNPPRLDLEPTEPWRDHTYEWMIGRVEPEFTEPAIADAFAAYVAEHNPRSPTGPGREATIGPVPVRPEKIDRPTMMAYGATAAKGFYMQGAVSREEFFGQLQTDDKCFVIVPEAGDYMQFQHGRFRFHDYLHDFLLPGIRKGGR
jgi:pimeloyl-ACP methyl ester carboxylesterase